MLVSRQTFNFLLTCHSLSYRIFMSLSHLVFPSSVRWALTWKVEPPACLPQKRLVLALPRKTSCAANPQRWLRNRSTTPVHLGPVPHTVEESQGAAAAATCSTDVTLWRCVVSPSWKEQLFLQISVSLVDSNKNGFFKALKWILGFTSMQDSWFVLHRRWTLYLEKVPLHDFTAVKC